MLNPLPPPPTRRPCGPGSDASACCGGAVSNPKAAFRLGWCWAVENGFAIELLLGAAFLATPDSEVMLYAGVAHSTARDVNLVFEQSVDEESDLVYCKRHAV